MSNSNGVTCAGTTSNLKRKSFEALGEQLSSYLPSRRAGCTQDMQERQDKKEIEECVTKFQKLRVEPYERLLKKLKLLSKVFDDLLYIRV